MLLDIRPAQLVLNIGHRKARALRGAGLGYAETARNYLAALAAIFPAARATTFLNGSAAYLVG